MAGIGVPGFVHFIHKIPSSRSERASPSMTFVTAQALSAFRSFE